MYSFIILYLWFYIHCTQHHLFTLIRSTLLFSWFVFFISICFIPKITFACGFRSVLFHAFTHLELYAHSQRSVFAFQFPNFCAFCVHVYNCNWDNSDRLLGAIFSGFPPAFRFSIANISFSIRECDDTCAVNIMLLAFTLNGKLELRLHFELYCKKICRHSKGIVQFLMSFKISCWWM